MNFVKLAIVYQIKHWISESIFRGDYLFQRSFKDWGNFIPLCKHSLIHSGFTFSIAWYKLFDLEFCLKVACFDFALYFVIDQIKASPDFKEDFPSFKKWQYWWLFGLEEIVHHISHYIIIYFLMDA